MVHAVPLSPGLTARGFEAAICAMKRRVGIKPEALLTVAEMAAADEAAIRSGFPVDDLMENGGRAVADVALASAAGRSRFLVLCGPGNNGGDGYVAARLLAERGFEVRIHAKSAPEEKSAAARVREACVAGQSIQPGPMEDFAPDAGAVVIDALYGAGLSRPVIGAEAEAIARLNASSAHVVSVDVPSGLHGDTGQALGRAVLADETVTFFRRKPGHLLWPGRSLCGALSCVDIGLVDAHLSSVRPVIFRNGPALWEAQRPPEAPDSHKYQRGHCLVVSGSELRTGASRLTAWSALHAGAGAVTLCGEADALRVHAAHVTVIMLREAATADTFRSLIAEGRFGAVVIGPAAGIGAETLERIGHILRASLPAVLDADALTSLVGHLALLRDRRDASLLVLTPHAGEFDRLFGSLEDDAAYTALPAIQKASKIEKARAAARLSRSIIVLKGIDTVIAAPDGRAAINDNAGPELASAGSGDVLAGIIGAHLAQGMAGFEAAASAVFLHGATGATIGTGLTAERLAYAVRPLFRHPPET
jgi:ADP-dependent NAD(P)H-hydrate dehydratase / NAD(P)H-hydrate epimerase